MGHPIDARVLLDALKQMAGFTKTCVLSAVEQQTDLTMKVTDLVRADRENAIRIAEATANRFERIEARIATLERALGVKP
jgi:hypothetical protein